MRHLKLFSFTNGDGPPLDTTAFPNLTSISFTSGSIDLLAISALVIDARRSVINFKFFLLDDRLEIPQIKFQQLEAALKRFCNLKHLTLYAGQLKPQRLITILQSMGHVLVDVGCVQFKSWQDLYELLAFHTTTSFRGRWVQRVTFAISCHENGAEDVITHYMEQVAVMLNILFPFLRKASCSFQFIGGDGGLRRIFKRLLPRVNLDFENQYAPITLSVV